jgi:hypothetical protein
MDACVDDLLHICFEGVTDALASQSIFVCLSVCRDFPMN